MEKLMKINKYLSGIAASALVMSYVSSASANTIAQVNAGKLTLSDAAQQTKKISGLYIVQMKGASAIAKATEIGELIPSNQLVAIGGNNYNANTPTMQAYVATMKQRQAAVAQEIGVNNVIHNYTHAYNGFSARLSPSQVKAMRSHPDVASVYEDELYQLQTANTPAFLGLTGPDGQHTLGIKGEDVVVGIIDSGIWPENPSFSDNPEIPEMSYGSAPEGWAGACNEGSIGEFTNAAGEVVYNDETMDQNVIECNGKLIGARYFGGSFSSVYEIQFGLGEFASARDADGHGSHTASTSAGNEGVAAEIQGTSVGTVSGIAPRARVAAYKVCWNSSYVSPEGVDERGCFFGDSMAAIDQAVVDGVDVLNYSIGNSNDINTPVYVASLRAQAAGVFFSGSAGNSGPTPETVSNIAPWIATVAASTYDGVSAVIGNLLSVNSGTLAGTEMFSVHSGIGPAVPAEGLSGDLGVASPIQACEALTTDLTGKIALIARGTCNFSDKFLNAQAAGATGIVVYTDERTPIAMGGEGDGITIPGVMVTNADGLALADSVSGSDFLVNVTFTNEAASGSAVEVGNIMASFSSRGVNSQTNDILKPDITAPGVRILAASSPEQLQISTSTQGENFAYLQGTSMSSPHIAGMAALLMGQHPEWSPAQVKSALMTSARQDIVKEDGSTPADPFDFGAGHAVPVAAMNPGLVYDANIVDYAGFLCGQGEEALVTSLIDVSCATVAGAGYATDASQLNYPSIAVSNLSDTQTISRTVTDVTGEAGLYTVTVDAPAGVSVSVETFDATGAPTTSGMVEVDANGIASYALTFTPTDAAATETWLFGSVTLEGTDGTQVRSPIAVNVPAVVADATIEVPESLSVQLNRGRATVFVQTLYSGGITVEHNGLAPIAGGLSGTSTDAGGADFDFGTAVGLGEYFTFGTPAGTKLMRLALADSLVSQAGANLDLHLWTCTGAGSCGPMENGISENADSNEDLIILDPVAVEGDPDSFFLLFVHAKDGNGAATVDSQTLVWFVGDAESTTRVSTSPRAVANRFQNISLRTRGLDPDQLYMGTMTFFDADGVNQGTTILEVQP
jgi:subtilisin family serine protease